MRCPSGTTSGTGRGRSRSSPSPSRTDAGLWRPFSPTRPGPLRTRETWRSSPRRSGPRWSRRSSLAPPPDSRSPSCMSTQAASPAAAGPRWAPTPPFSASRPPESPSQCSAVVTIWRRCSAAPRGWWLMGRSALLALLPALLITTGWQTLEEPVRGGEFAVAAALAVVSAALPRRSLRIGAMLVSGVAVASFAFDVSPLEARPFDADHDFIDPVVNGLGGGLADFYEVSLPFDPAERVLMHGVVVLAVFAFTVAAA